jgi:DNA-binding HxlR family transcriptional regulator
MIVEGEFYIKFHRSKLNNFKMAFLSELVRACQQNHSPTIIGGRWDFNIMWHSKEKNNDRFNDR